MIDNRVAESSTIEYKAELPGSRDHDKREFLADVAAIANTNGGVIIYGMETERDDAGSDTGVPSALRPLRALNVDQERNRLLSMLQDGVSPALASASSIQEVSVENEGTILVLGVRRSLAAPHMITFQKSGKFWRRSEVGKYQPDIAEIRRMFLESRSWIQECEEFRTKRLATVANKKNLDGQSLTLIHVLPLGRLDALLDLISPLRPLSEALPPPDYWSSSNTFNADGYQTYAPGPEQKILSYTQWFRFGGIEGFTSTAVEKRELVQGQPFLQLWGEELCKTVRAYVPRAVSAMTECLGHHPPFALLLTLRGLRDALISPGGYRWGAPIDVDELSLPAILIDDQTDVDSEIQKLLDVVYQSGGLRSAPRPQSRSG